MTQPTHTETLLALPIVAADAPPASVRCLWVRRTAPDQWDCWTPGQCACQVAAHLGMNLDLTAATIGTLRP